MAKKIADEDLQNEHDDELEEGEELESGSEGDGSDGDARTKNEGEDQHEGHQDENAEGLSEEQREAIRARRRDERQRKKQAQRDREESLKRELAARDQIIEQMNNRLNLVERKSNGADMAQLDAVIKQASDASAWFKQEIANAYAAGDHARAADATEKMVAAREEAQRYNNIKQAYGQRQQQPQTLDPRVRQRAEQFVRENKWLDLNGSNEDSRIAITIDHGLTREGWDARTDEYWEEYRARLKKYLPHRVVDSAPQQRREVRKSVVTGSGRESSSGASKGEYNLSPERVAAMKEAGAWDNPEKRKKMIDAYRNYDKQNRN